MSFSFFSPARLAATLVLAAPLFLHADAPVVVGTLDYVRPDSVPNVTTRQDAKGHRGAVGPIPANFSLAVLSPDHTGLTVREHPSIFWYMNLPVKGVRCQVTVLKDVEGDVDPVIEKYLDSEKVIGIQRLNLDEIAKGLEAGAEYKVIVSLILDENQRSKDVVAVAHIKRVPATEKLLSKLLTRPTPDQRAEVYASQGIWYDALSAISDQIAAHPADKQLHKVRAALLLRGDLKDASEYDEKLAI